MPIQIGDSLAEFLAIKADTDKNGKTSLDEGKIRPANKNEKRDPPKLFNRLDKNGGFVDASEIATLANRRFHCLASFRHQELPPSTERVPFEMGGKMVRMLSF